MQTSSVPLFSKRSAASFLVGVDVALYPTDDTPSCHTNQSSFTDGRDGRFRHCVMHISVELRSVPCGVAVFVNTCSAVLIQEVPNEVAVFVKHGRATMLM